MLKHLIPTLTATLMGAAMAADLPDLGEQSQATLTAQQEQSIGENAMRELRFSKEWLGDTEINEYLSHLMNRIVSSNPDIRQEFHPVALADNSINAFALPGGVVGIHTGLLIAANNESELAAVLAHEMAHVTQHHTARMIASQQKTIWPTLAMLAAILVASRTNSNTQAIEAGIVSAQAYSIQDQLDYTRNHEREADRIGMQFLKNAGFDPRAMPSFFEKLQQANRLQESNAPAFLRTHPITTARIADAQARLKDEPYRQYPNSQEFLFMREKARALTLPAILLEAELHNRIKSGSAQNKMLARYGLAWLYIRQELPDKANTVLTPEDKASDIAAEELLSATILAKTGNISSAISKLKKIIEKRPQTMAPWQTLIETRFATEDFQTSIDEIKTIQTIFPEWLDPQEWQAKALSKLQREVDSHIALASFYKKLGAQQESIRQLHIARDNPDTTPEQKKIIEYQLKTLTEQNIKTN